MNAMRRQRTYSGVKANANDKSTSVASKYLDAAISNDEFCSKEGAQSRIQEGRANDFKLQRVHHGKDETKHGNKQQEDPQNSRNSWF
jgi:hypothetical protein